jgi:glucosyl-3-phosphoglycerate synthase
MKMATDILTTIYRTLASQGSVLDTSHFLTIRSAYLRTAQDAIRQYNADAILNGLIFDRHAEEAAVEGFAQCVIHAGEIYRNDPVGAAAIPNWARVLTAFPDFPDALREVARADAAEAAV